MAIRPQKNVGENMETNQIQKITDEESFSVQALSASQIKQFDRGPYWFWKSSPFNPDKEPEKETDALVFGKLCHCLLLEPGMFLKEYQVVDFGKTRANKKYEQAKEENPGKIIINPEEFEHATKMIQNVHEHKLASIILDGATAEMPFIWREPVTGMMFKAKLDAIKRTKNGIVVIDYKTSSSIPEILKYAQKLQYPIQSDIYSRAVEAKYGEKPCEFVFIIQSNKPGEEDIVCVANVEQETQRVAHDIVDAHMSEIKVRLDRWNETHDKSIWSAYPEREMISYSNYFMTYGD